MTEAQPSCCPEGSWGAPLDIPCGDKSFGNASGESVMIGPDKNLEVYVAKPDAAVEKAMMVFTDVYGLQSRLFAILDKLATDLKLYIVAIDCFRGETMNDHTTDALDWLRKHPFDDGQGSIHKDGATFHTVAKDIGWCFEFLSEKFGVDSSNVGAIGFCWGVWAFTKACAMGIHFKCGVGFHPSLTVEERAFGMDHVNMAKLASERTPLLYCVAGNDPDNLKPPGGEVAQMLSSSNHNAENLKKQQPKCVEFPDQAHGWVSGGIQAKIM